MLLDHFSSNEFNSDSGLFVFVIRKTTAHTINVSTEVSLSAFKYKAELSV
ncbi:MAG: hypothetical protein ACJA0Q_001715 [Saprospiraceae bacterium]|jgi:hypothetical protein